jgi:hypothetical protein
MSDKLYRYENGQKIECTVEEVEKFRAEQKSNTSNDLNIEKSRKRQRRNALLAASDWTQANDSPLAAEKKVEWATYRTALRDLPSSSDWPSVTFPTEPS